MNKRILIIDDAQDIANVFKKQLDLLGGYDVDLASGGKQGLEMIESNNYDLVLLDLVMPELDGIEVLRIIKKDTAKYKNPAIIVMTNVTAADTKKVVEELGVVDFVVKTDTDIDMVVSEFFKNL